MATRQYVSAGIALVTTGIMVAALPSILPPPTPPDVTISAHAPKSVYAEVELRDLHALIDAFFASGVPGVTQEILLELADGNVALQDLINGFFDGDPNGGDFEYPGIPDPIRQLIQAGIPDGSLAEKLVDGFFLNGGAPEVLNLLLTANLDPTSLAAQVINGFFHGNADSDFEYPGIPEPIRLLIQQAIPDGSLAEKVVDGFFLNGGAPEVLNVLLTANLDPNSLQAKVINGFFHGNPDSDFEYPGIPEPIRLLIQEAIPDGSAAETLVDAFFLEGGAPAVVGHVLLGVSNAIFGANSIPSGAITAFFFGYPPVAAGEDPSPSGVVGLTHFIIDALLGDITPPPPAPPLAPLAKTFLAKAGTANPGVTVDLPKVSDPIDTDAPTVTLRTVAPADKDASALASPSTAAPVTPKVSDPTPVVVVSVPAPATPVASVPAPATPVAAVPAPATPVAAVPAPATPVAAEVDPAPAATASGEATGKADDVTDKVKSGNKAEVNPLLLKNGGGGGSLQETVKQFGDFMKKLRGGDSGAAKADSTTGDAGSAG